MRARAVTLLLGLVLAATALLASGCGARLDAVASAATRTSAASGARFTMTMGMTAPGLPAPVKIRATGAFDGSGRLLMRFDPSGLAGPGEAAAATPMTIVEDGNLMYLAGGPLEGRIPGGARWARIDVARAFDLDLTRLAGGQSDPRMSLEQLRHAGNVVAVGPARVRGLATTRYSVLLDLEKGLDRVDSAVRPAVKAVLDRLEAEGHRYVPADAWIDGDGYLRRYSFAIPDYLGAGSSMSFLLDLDDLDTPVAITLPPESEVADLTASLTAALS